MGESQQSWWKWALFGLAGLVGFQLAAKAADRGLERSRAAKRNGRARKKRGLAGACWPGFEAYGMKRKGRRLVPACAPKRRS